jgi:preprotein translocase subunit SecD
MTPRRRFRWALLTMLFLIGGIWGVVAGLGLEPRLGLDLQGGISVVLTAEGSPDEGSIDKAVDIIRNRVDALGVAEPDISRQGSNVLVQLPGVEERQKALKLIGTTAQLRFRPVVEVLSAGGDPWKAATPPDCSDAGTFPADDPTKEQVLCTRTFDTTTPRLDPSSGTSCASVSRR